MPMFTQFIILKLILKEIKNI